jgi:hypothetical protein
VDDFEGLIQVIADLETEVLVTKPWHQADKPHFTVQLRLITSRYKFE